MRPDDKPAPDCAPLDATDLTRRALLASGVVAPLLPALGHAQAPLPPTDPQTLVLSNDLVRRTLTLPGEHDGALLTREYRPQSAPSRYTRGHDGTFHKPSIEFGFDLDGKALDSSSGFGLRSSAPATDANGGQGVELTLRHKDEPIEVLVRYLLYPGSAVVRKRVTIRNLGRAPVRIENVIVECFALEDYWPGTMSWVYSDYGRRKSLAPFVGGRQDSLVALHNPDWGEGVVLGNEAAGVMKYTGAFDGGTHFRAGLARSDASYPFRRWLAAGESYSAPQVFSLVYTGTPRFETVLSGAIPDFVRRHLGLVLSRGRPRFNVVYNSWEPFQKNINGALLREVATAAAAAGAKTFVVDDGWQDFYGDWGVDRAKFPGGLRPLMDHVKALGMKPGLWVSIGSAEPRSRVLREHPEWFLRNAAGKLYSAHSDADTDKLTACMSSGWKDYITGVLDRPVREHGLEYLKLDFAVVVSAYQYDPARSGCHAKGHAHRDRPESLSLGYDGLWSVFDSLKAAHPTLFIDCTFETMGGNQLVDYAMLQHADGSWLSNYNEPDAANDLRIRNMAWWRSPAMPAAALVIGNAKLNDAGMLLHVKSLAGALPIMLGDPRQMPPQLRERCRGLSDWLAAVDKRHGYLPFRQDLPGFGEPAEGGWDGFQRVNTDTRSGGLIGIFRHGAVEDARRMTIAGLSPRRRYRVRTETGKEVARGLGAELAAEGFTCRLPRRYDGELFEVLSDGAA